MLKKEVRKFEGAKEGFKEIERIKTELCRNWETGKCEYGDKCNFAHGVHELRDKFGAKGVKERCENYFKFGYCISGSKCAFSHFGEGRTGVQRDGNVLFIDLEMRNH